ncbi:MAG: hypothetical protein IJR01_04985 [Bacteroidales bacterium]|nr:hypothetical protein [Bacteroidales bacterium]
MKRHFLISAILMSLMFVTSAFGQTSNPSGVKAVNIGLSVRWADRNVGADSPSDYGDYYAWGEVEFRNSLACWENYKWHGTNGLTKYNFDEKAGIVDNKGRLDEEDDVAFVKLGEGWRMPTYIEFKELVATVRNVNYKWKLTSMRGHKGWKITYLVNKQSIFLPFAGGEDGVGIGSYGTYWTSSATRSSAAIALSLYKYSFRKLDPYRAVHDQLNWYGCRYCRYSVRAVRD